MHRLRLDADGRTGPGSLVLVRADVLNSGGLAGRIREFSGLLGFSVCGIARARRLKEGQALRGWLEKGYHAGMAWMENPSLREDPTRLMPGTRSIVSVGINCHRASQAQDNGWGRIACFATGQDYHGFMRRKLNRLLEMVKELVPVRGRAAVDSAPVLERAWAAAAGIGWPGRNSCLVSPRHGPWLLLGELMLDIELMPDEPVPGRCGTCDRCMKACPTGAIVSPGTVDSRRCIAYLTIEEKGSVPASLRSSVGAWLFGCDRCLEACPWGREARGSSGFPARFPSSLRAADFLGKTEDAFRRTYAGSPLMRAGRSGMARNAAIVLGNVLHAESLPLLEGALGDPDPLVRTHVAWALGRYRSRKALSRRLRVEESLAVRREIEAALAGAAEEDGAGARIYDEPRT